MTNDEKWREYYERAISFPHRALTEFAEKRNSSNNYTAIDCGCGTGADASFLLNRNYYVHAFDVNPDSVNICKSRFASVPRISVSQNSFECFDYPSCGVMVANSSLYFCKPMRFEQAWEKIVGSIEAGGVFVGDFMGPLDTWAIQSPETITAVEPSDVKGFFEEFDILFYTERNERGETAAGDSKHWHIFTLVAKKHS